MTSRHRVVVSAENNGYIGWQCKLFYYSCVSRTGQQPLFIVHATGGAWHPYFQDLVKAGALIHSAPSYARTPHDWYLAKNTAGSLLHAAELFAQDEWIVLCDPDMVFVRQPEFSCVLSAASYDYLDYDRAEAKEAARKLGLPWEAVLREHHTLCGGVPYVVPVAEARPLAQAWLEAVDAFPPRHWEDIMYAFGLAAVKLHLPVTLTETMEQDLYPNAAPTCEMIHYCQGTDIWDKRYFFHEEEVPQVWYPRPEAVPGTILGEILGQIREAREFYGESSGSGSETFPAVG